MPSRFRSFRWLGCLIPDTNNFTHGSQRNSSLGSAGSQETEAVSLDAGTKLAGAVCTVKVPDTESTTLKDTISIRAGAIKGQDGASEQSDTSLLELAEDAEPRADDSPTAQQLAKNSIGLDDYELVNMKALRDFARYVNQDRRPHKSPDGDSSSEAHEDDKNCAAPDEGASDAPVDAISTHEPEAISAALGEAGTSEFTFPNLRQLKQSGQVSKQIAVARHCPEDLKPAGDGSWDIADFMLLKKMYSGNVSAVVKALHKPSGRVVAVKIYRRAHMHDMERYQLAREICLHVRMHHPHIVQLYAAWKDSQHVYLVLQFCEGGNLLDHLVANRQSMTEADISRRVLRPLLSALAFLHQRDLLHRDIKLENILLDANKEVKLADFGLAIDRRHEAANTRLGTYGYFAPEVLRCQLKSSPFDGKAAPPGYDSKVDVWSLGVLAYEVLVGKAPFAAASPELILEAIQHRKLEYPCWLTPAARDFLKQALQREPGRRLASRQLLGHPFITMHSCAGRRRLSAPVGTAQAAMMAMAAGPLAMSAGLPTVRVKE